jgi:hypothetical protein
MGPLRARAQAPPLDRAGRRSRPIRCELTLFEHGVPLEDVSRYLLQSS